MLIRIGYWAQTRARSPMHVVDALFAVMGVHGEPDPRRLVDHTWDRREREAVARYLDAGDQHEAYLGFSYCRFECGIPDHQMGTRDLTDGVYLWPEGLSHYVLEHHVRLPDTFIRHVLAQRL